MRSLPLLVALAPALALAQPTVSIVEPGPGDCMASGAGTIDGAPGGNPFVPPTDIPLRLRLSGPGDGPITVRVLVDGEVVAQGPFEVGPVAQETDLFFVASDAIEDGPARRIGVEVSAAGGEASDEVVVQVNRAPPRLVFDEAELADLGACFVGDPPALDPVAVDDQDPDPVLESETVQLDCEVEQRFTAVDACGNGQRVVAATVRPAPDPLRPVLEGVAPGARVFEAVLNYQIRGTPGCPAAITATVTRGEETTPLQPGATLAAPGDYVARVVVEACGAEPTEDELPFTIISEPQADPGGPYQAFQGDELVLSAAGSSVPPEAGAITSYGWDLDGDGFFDPEEGEGVETTFDTLQPDGVYRVGVRIRTQTGFEDFGYTDVVLLDISPVCAAGGPYEVEQGEALELDGTGSRAGHPSEPILAYDWDFGDERFPQRGLNPTPVHRYEDEGDFTVTLRVEDQDSECEDQATVTVIDVQPVIRNLRARDADDLVEGDTVTFTAGQTSAGSAAEPLTEFRWDFGDGTNEAGEELRGPVHTYDDSGDFDVCLEVSDIDSSISECIQITVADLQPRARLAGPGFAIEGAPVVFDATGSRAGGAADPLTRYVWDFGDGGDPVEVLDLEQTTIEHRFAANGELLVTLQVWDEDSFAEVSQRIVVADARPTVSLVGVPGRIAEGRIAELDASGSAPGSESDPIVVYRWDFGDGTTVEGPEPVVEHAWPDDGIYSVRLEVADQDGSRAATDAVVNVFNEPPANVRIEGPAQAEVGIAATWRVVFDDVEGDAVIANWSMGDGTRYSDQYAVEHAYAAPSSFTLRVRLDDGDGGTAEVERDVVVTGAAPAIAGPTEVDGVEGEALSFELELTSAPDADGGFDGPVRVRVAGAPSGGQVIVLPGDEPARDQTLRFEWTPGASDAGQRTLRFVARAPSGIEREHTVVLRIRDAGGSRLVALGGRGRITVYAYERDDFRELRDFSTIADLELAGTATDLDVDPAGRWAYATMPGIGVTVIALQGTPRVVRRIPIAGPVGALYADADEVFVFGRGQAIWIDPATLKVRGRVTQPTLPPAVAVAARGDALVLASAQGFVTVIDRAALRAGEDPVVDRIELGGRLHLVAADGDDLYVGDVQNRRVVHLDADDETEGVLALPFAPRDLAVEDGALWLTSERGLETRDADGEPRVVFRGVVGGLALLPTTLFGRPALALSAGEGIDNLGREGLEGLGSARAGGARRLRHVVVP